MAKRGGHKTIGKRARATTTKTKSGKTVTRKSATMKADKHPFSRTRKRKVTTTKTQSGKTVKIDTRIEQIHRQADVGVKLAEKMVKTAKAKRAKEPSKHADRMLKMASDTLSSAKSIKVSADKRKKKK